ncbi:winged helix-turn-helix transcriptional regulator [Candidatus Bathyarchaeota archaeon]|nr:winged helix-turn-helix transcriptional regulator [Candidatus Bathyarchaeota archaeon]
MSLVKTLINPDQTTIKLGEPWKLPKASGFIVPILRDPPYNKRGYILIQEAEGKVDFRDSGGISGVDAENKTGKYVLIRKGTMLKGQGTQSRAPIHSFILEPKIDVVRVPVNCIHQTHGISGGAMFHAEGVAPLSVQANLGEQSSTWSSIRRYSAKVAKQGGMAESTRVSNGDNLVGVETITQGDTVADALQNIPGDHVNQVGVAVFDLEGVIAVEIFDHPESWRAFSGSIIRSYREVLSEEASELIEIRTEKAGEVFWRYMKRLPKMEKILITETTKSKVWNISDNVATGEITELEGEEIHLMLNRHMDTPPDPFGELQDIMGGAGGVEASISTDETEQYVQRRGGFQLLQKLGQMPQRFSELLESVDVSRGTLSTRVKEAEDLGLVEKGIRKTNGHPAYILTEEGEEVKKESEKKAK